MKRWIALFWCVWAAASHADVVLPKVIGSHMVLQRGVSAPVWGWASPGEEVTVEFAGQVKTALPDASGKWMVRLDPLEASSESRVMTIRGNNEVLLQDVLVGEVWLAAGQSNMEWTFAQIAPEEWAYAQTHRSNRQVRAFHVYQHLTAGVPLDDTLGTWKTSEAIVATPHSVSAVGFFFAIKLQQELGVPVAIIDANWGGQRIEMFIPDEGFQAQGIPYQKAGPVNLNHVSARLRGLAAEILAAADAAEQGRKIAYPVQDIRAFGWSLNALYNAMIAPLVPYGLRGAIWYQGESNRGAHDYFNKLQALSAGLSAVFGVKDIPIHQVQIAPFSYNKAGIGQDTTLCDTIWKAQYRAADEIPGMSVVAIHDNQIDIMDIHPRHKRTVGERLAARALKSQYGKNLVASGPRVDRVALKDAGVVVTFRDIDQGLETSDGAPPSWFELSGDGSIYVRADAVIIGNTVQVSSPGVPSPRFVRMGWRETEIPNLRDKNGWPVFAFPGMEVPQPAAVGVENEAVELKAAP